MIDKTAFEKMTKEEVIDLLVLEKNIEDGYKRIISINDNLKNIDDEYKRITTINDKLAYLEKMRATELRFKKETQSEIEKLNNTYASMTDELTKKYGILFNEQDSDNEGDD